MPGHLLHGIDPFCSERQLSGSVYGIRAFSNRRVLACLRRDGSRRCIMNYILYHTGYQEIRDPDILFDRKNADKGYHFQIYRNADTISRLTGIHAPIHASQSEFSVMHKQL